MQSKSARPGVNIFKILKPLNTIFKRTIAFGVCSEITLITVF